MQVEYAMQAVEKGASVVGLVGSDCIVLGVEKRTKEKLQVRGCLVCLKFDVDTTLQ